MKKAKDPRSNALYGVLYDNRPPTYAEVASLHDGIKTITGRMAELRGELADLEDQLHRHHSALAPVRRLPFEILGEIFGLAVGYDCQEDPDPEDVLNLVLVCKTWRNAALACRRLWSTVSVCGPKMTQKEAQSVARWIGRSKGSNKSIIVRNREMTCPCTNSVPKTCDCLNSTFLKFLSKASPISRLVLTDFGLQCAGTLLNTLQERGFTNALQSLEFRVCDEKTVYDAWAQQAEVFQLALGKLSPITDLCLKVPKYRGNDTSHLRIPIPTNVLNKLTTFSIKCGWAGSQVLAVLQHCINVERLSLHFDDANPVWYQFKNSVGLSEKGHFSMPKVHTLYLNLNGPENTGKSLRLLRFPNLSTLWVGWNRWGDIDHSNTPLWILLDSLNAFASLDRAPIRNLYIDKHCWPTYSKISTEDLTKVLSDLPDLVDLSTVMSNFDPADFLNRQPKGKEAANAPLLAPNLERWELTNTRDPFHLDSFLKYLKSRQRHRKQKGKVLFQEPMNKLKTVLFTGDDWREYAYKKLRKSYDAKQSALDELRNVLGINVERFGAKDMDDY